MFFFPDSEKYDEHEDTKAAIQTFAQYFEAENNVKFIQRKLEGNITLVGGNFCSRILRLNFEYLKGSTTVSDSVLLKVPSLSMNYEAILKASIYDNELHAYQHLLPALYKIWHGERFTPIFYACTEAKVLILEDLTKNGFKPRNKKDRLDLAHSRAALTVLATFHAVTVKYLQELENRQEPISQPLLEPIKPANFKDQAQYFYEQVLELAKGRTSESVMHKLQNFQDKLVTSSPYHINSDHNNLTVIAHGDYWTTNILFQYNDKGEVTGTRMVDWQISRRTCAVVDLIYLFVTSLKFEVFRDHKDELINLYLETLNKTLSIVKANCTYTRTQFDEDVQTYRYLFLNLLINAVPISVQDAEMFFKDNRLADNASPELIELMTNWFTYLDANDFL